MRCAAAAPHRSRWQGGSPFPAGSACRLVSPIRGIFIQFAGFLPQFFASLLSRLLKVAARRCLAPQPQGAGTRRHSGEGAGHSCWRSWCSTDVSARPDRATRDEDRAHRRRGRLCQPRLRLRGAAHPCRVHGSPRARSLAARAHCCIAALPRPFCSGGSCECTARESRRAAARVQGAAGFARACHAGVAGDRASHASVEQTRNANANDSSSGREGQPRHDAGAPAGLDVVVCCNNRERTGAAGRHKLGRRRAVVAR